MSAQESWFSRLEKKRGATGKQKFADGIPVSRTTYDKWIKGESSPTHPEVIDRIAELLDEDRDAVEREIRLGGGVPSYRPIFEVARGADLSVRLYQEHVRGLAHVLGQTDHLVNGGRAEEWSGGRVRRSPGVDVVARLLRERLPRLPQPLDVAVVVRPTSRGSSGPCGRNVLSRHEGWEPYQYQIYVLPERVAATTTALNVREMERLLGTLRNAVDEVLADVRVPVTREHSLELFLDAFAGKSDLLLYPGLLEMALPDPRVHHHDTTDILVAGVYYAGAPDVGALLSRQLRTGFAIFDQMARLQVRAGLRGLDSNRLDVVARATALEALGGSPTADGPMVWATDNPESILVSSAVDALREFSGRRVLLLLDDEALRYAAFRVACVDGPAPEPELEARWLRTLRRQQEQLANLLKATSTVYEVNLPASASRRADGGFPDAVDEMFDVYDHAAQTIARGLTNAS